MVRPHWGDDLLLRPYPPASVGSYPLWPLRVHEPHHSHLRGPQGAGGGRGDSQALRLRLRQPALRLRPSVWDVSEDRPQSRVMSAPKVTLVADFDSWDRQRW